MDKLIKERFILVSNRLPITINQTEKGLSYNASNGGLVAGLREIHNRSNSIWIGHSGIYSNHPEYPDLHEKLKADRLVSVPLTEAEYQAYYNGACNNIIWPLFHYFPGSIVTKSEDWQAYEQVNQKFAESILEVAKPGDKIWVHDYQLMQVPALVRKANPQLNIGYFHHIPFPSSELFRILYLRKEILLGLLGAEIIGFHTQEYVCHFLTSVKRILGCQTHLDEILFEGRKIKVIAQPLGVDVQMIRKQNDENASSTRIKELVNANSGRKILLGMDRLDYTKGIPERLLGFREFLKKYPQYIGQVNFIQICVPSRTDIQSYRDLKAEVERIIDQINDEFSAPGYTPIQYLYRSFSKEEIIAFYRLADVAVVTPLCDGLNLVSKEYVAARDDEDGVLILSEMAGAAAELGEAIQINPYDSHNFVDAIYTALTMTVSERQCRMQLLRKRIIEYDNLSWLKNFNQNWDESIQRNQHHGLVLHEKFQIELLKNIEQSKRCFVFIDYDSAQLPDVVLGQADFKHSAALRLVQALGAIPNLNLTLLTQKSKEFCETNFQHLPVNVVSENGGYIQIRPMKNWQLQFAPDAMKNIEQDILRLFESYSQHVAGSFILRKECCIIWNYEQADFKIANNQSHDLMVALSQMLENTVFGVYAQRNQIEVRPVMINKAFAIAKILQQLERNPEDLLITIGNETLYQEIQDAAIDQYLTFHIETPALFAKYHLDSLEDTQQLLQKIESRYSQIM